MPILNKLDTLDALEASLGLWKFLSNDPKAEKPDYEPDEGESSPTLKWLYQCSLCEFCKYRKIDDMGVGELHINGDPKYEADCFKCPMGGKWPLVNERFLTIPNEMGWSCLAEQNSKLLEYETPKTAWDVWFDLEPCQFCKHNKPDGNCQFNGDISICDCMPEHYFIIKGRLAFMIFKAIKRVIESL